LAGLNAGITGSDAAGRTRRCVLSERADGKKYYFFQYWIDVPGQEERRRQTEVIGLVSQMTRSEAERKKLDCISRLQFNSNDYRIPWSHNLADAVKRYRHVFAPRMLRDSTLSVCHRRLTTHPKRTHDTESSAVSCTQSTGSTTRGFARVSTRMQPAMGVGRDQSRRYPSTDGTQFSSNDCAL
jgi:hypothetical protein